MALFQTSVLKRELEKQDKLVVEKAYKRFKKYFFNTTIQQNIRDSKEEQFQEGFLRELFVNVLGYTINPSPNFNLTTEFKNLKGAKKADGSVLIDGKALAVIELKSTKVKNLEEIRVQAFDYKSHHPTCKYVITSTFDRLRFYIENSVDFEEFDLFTITPERFDLLYFCLSKENLTENIPLQTKEASVIEEEKVTKKLYADYSLFKREIFRDIVKNNMTNPELRELTEKDIKKSLFKKTQKLLDRFLFVFFAEDRGLLPPNSISQIIDKWQDDVDFGEDKRLYDIYKSYFHVLDIGRKKHGNRPEIFAYNGGLFKPDPILDALIIDDDLLKKHTATLTKYDFETDVDVNILGHIFENSLNEIESINAEIEGVEFDKQKTKRKKDGVFYTPKYITKYIVDNTIGKLCEEKKKELEINDDVYLYAKQRSKKRIDNLEEYRKYLLQLTICDPACGSGAFLNQALDFLIKEHAYIDELTAKYHNVPLVLSEVENSILENNIYGVDLNEESVEIAKLSLWLRTAQKGRKLTSLSSNIKCGNSLIDNKAVAGDKAFNWQNEFPDVFANGGFDVIIGNPPYVRVQTIKDSIENESLELEKKYSSATRRYDLFVLFIEKSYYLVNNSGKVGFILPHKFLIADFGFGIRKFLKEKSFINRLVHFGHEIVFEVASTYTCIIQLEKNSNNFDFIEIKPTELFEKMNFSNTKIEELSDEKWELHDNNTGDLINKLKRNKLKLENILDTLSQGIKNTSDKIFMIRGRKENGIFYGYSDELQEKIEIEADIMYPVAKGKDIKRYEPLDINYHVIYPHYHNGKKTVPFEEPKLKNEFPKAYEYLSLFKDFLIEKKVRFKTNPKYWYSLHRPREINIFSKDKIVIATIQNYPHFTIDKTKSLTDAGGYALTIKENIGLEKEQLLPILNSNLMWFFIKNTSSVFRGGYYAFNTTYLNPFPLPDILLINEKNFSNLSNNNNELTLDFLRVKKQFCKYLQSQFNIEKLSKKLQNWHELEFADFIKELNKAIKKVGGEKLSKLDEMEWMEVFEAKKIEAQALKTEIDKTDTEIDAMVYDLYGLTEEEIKIVEGAV